MNIILKAKWDRFWKQDLDTILFKIMCVTNIVGLMAGLGYLWLVDSVLPENMDVCMFHSITGLYCPGCGGTRAFQALFSGHVLKAFYYHPAGMYGIFLYVIYFVSQAIARISKGKVKGISFRPVYLYIMLGLILLNFIVRNVLLYFFHIPTL